MDMKSAIATLDNVIQALDPLLVFGSRMSGREIGLRVIGSINDIEQVKAFLSAGLAKTEEDESPITDEKKG